jgi:calcineurin-like phosphoesterase family protein
MSMKPLRLSAKNLYVCADLHYGHNNKIIWGQRGCRSVDAHDLMIEEQLDKLPRWAKVIQLGDLAVCKPKRLEAFFDRRPDVTWYHLFGNHDETLKTLFKRWMEKSTMPDNHLFSFGESALVAVRSCPGVYRTIWLSHYPCALWPSEAEWHACGHAHARLREYNPGTAIKPMLDLGVENALKEDCVFLPWDVVEMLFRKAVIPQFSAAVKYNPGDKVMIGGCVATIIT